MANIRFWSIVNGKKQKPITYACFACLSDRMPDALQYLAVVDSTITDEQVTFWIDYVRRLFHIYDLKAKPLKKGKWKEAPSPEFRAQEPTPDGRYVLYLVNTKGIRYRKILPLLTALRYTHEFPSIVRETYEIRDMPEDKLFVEFQKVHIRHKTGNGHDLIDSGLQYFYAFGGEKPKPKPTISLEKFKKNLLDPAIMGVYAHFQ